MNICKETEISFDSTNLFDDNTLFPDDNVIDSRVFYDEPKKITFDLSSCMKSIDEPELLFTNFFKSKDEYYKCVSKEYKRFFYQTYYNDNDLFDVYELKNFGGEKHYKKINSIVSKTLGVTDIRLHNIKRLKHSFLKELQLFYYENGKNNLKFVVIDLHHLAIPANDVHDSNVKNDGIEKYIRNCKNKNYNIKLEDIKNSCK